MVDNMVKGIVLAGGQGKRLRPLTYYFQKCMIPVGYKQKPLLEYIIRLFAVHDITDVTLLVGYKHEQIVNYFNSGDRFGLKLTYALDAPTVKGTGASLLNAYNQGKIDPQDDVIIYYGDILSDLDLTTMLARHRSTRATATLALSKGYQVRVGVADIHDEMITGWTEKPRLDICAGIGVLILKAAAIPELEPMRGHVAELDIMGHLVPRLVEQKDAVHAYLTDAFWYDVGSAERYEKLDNGFVDNHLGHLFP
jgi:mannose-1-phosphate guanylyltransferase